MKHNPDISFDLSAIVVEKHSRRTGVQQTSDHITHGPHEWIHNRVQQRSSRNKAIRTISFNKPTYILKVLYLLLLCPSKFHVSISKNHHLIEVTSRIKDKG